MDVSRKARFGGVKVERFAALHSACSCWLLPSWPWWYSRIGLQPEIRARGSGRLSDCSHPGL